MHPFRPVALPRWEWRTFLPQPDPDSLGLKILERFARVDTHVLCHESAHDVRIREGRIELAWRKQMSPSGLELWDSVLVSSFPLAPDFLARLFVAWGIPLPDTFLTGISEEAFLQRLVVNTPTLRAIPVPRQVTCFELDGVRASFSRMTLGDSPLQSLHLVHEDPDLLVKVLQKSGLSKCANTNFPQGLKQALALQH